MGLFTNKKRPCPICGSPTPRLLPDGVEGQAICKACSKKADMPKDIRDGMSLEDFRQYIAFYEENKALRDSFKENFNFACSGWNDWVSIDTEHRLFRLKRNDESLALEASCLKAFRILEDNNLLFESCPEGLKCYESDAPARAQALDSAVAQFRIQYQQYEYMQEMEKKLKEETDGKSGTSFRYMSRPRFEAQVINGGFTIELTLEHPYWGGIRTLDSDAPKFDDTYPSVDDFLRKYQKKTEELHALALNLIYFINPNACEISIPLNMPAASQSVPTADPVAEIQKYKALLDSGAITQEEFSAKKRQLLGI